MQSRPFAFVRLIPAPPLNLHAPAALVPAIQEETT